MDGTVLVADDDRTIRTVLTQALTRAGCKVHATSSLVTLMRWVDEGKGDLVITDVMMPDGNGLEQVPLIGAARPGLPVIVISAQNTIMTAIKATEVNAFDYLPKPFDLPELMKRAAKALAVKRRVPAAVYPNADVDGRTAGADLPLVGHTAAMQAIYRLVAQVMNADMPVLITGESGTGKSLIARTIHDFSDRRGLPFVVVTGADLLPADGPAAVVERAKAGTLLFDEVTDLDAPAQAQIVRLIDSLGEGAPRILATAQGDLTGAMANGTFREDLFYRLGGVTIAVPPLRARVDDIVPLASHLLTRAAREGGALRGLSDDAVKAIRAFRWPGNVRQMENTLRRLVLTGTEPLISRAEIETLIGGSGAGGVTAGNAGFSGQHPRADDEKLQASVAGHLRRYFDLHGDDLPPAGLYQRILREIETPLIDIALDATAGNQAKCAALLGINRNTLRKKITDLDIQVARRRKLM